MTRAPFPPKPGKPLSAPEHTRVERAEPEPQLLRSFLSAHFAGPVSRNCRLSGVLTHPTASGRRRRAIHELLHPQLQRQELPNLHRPVLPPAAVFCDKPSHAFGTK